MWTQIKREYTLRKRLKYLNKNVPINVKWQYKIELKIWTTEVNANSTLKVVNNSEFINVKVL